MKTRIVKVVRRRHPINRIRATCSYDVSEVARLLGVHRNTVHHWLKDDLAPLDDRKPTLVHGTSLKAFLKDRQTARKHTCQVGEFFCFHCRQPRSAWGATADLRLKSEKTVNLSALCSTCETQMNRAVRRADVPKWMSILDLQTPGKEGLTDWNNPSLECAEIGIERDAQNQRRQ